MRSSGFLARRALSTGIVAVTVVAVVVVTLAAGVAAQTTTTTKKKGATGPLDRVTVTAAAGAGATAPTLKFKKPLAVKKSGFRVVSEGTGEQPTEGAKVTVHYLEVNGRTGKALVSSYGAKPQSLTLDAATTLPVMVKALLASEVGGQTLVAVSPKDAKQLQGAGQGVKKSDTLVFLLTLTGVRHPLSRAAGAPATPAAGLPSVTLAADGKPTIGIPAGVAASSSLVVQPLVVGTGPVVEAGQSVVVHYTGIVYGTGEQFDSSWDRGQPAEFVIGQGQVIAGWDKGIVGQTVGSQLLLVIPPVDGYGTTGNSGAGISGTDTLVFVVDILDAY